MLHTKAPRSFDRTERHEKRQASSPSRTPIARIEPLENRCLLSGDVVIEWNRITIDAIRSDQTYLGPTWASRNMAIVHAAIFDAVNAIDQSYQPYLTSITAPQWLSKKAAAAAAANRALDALYPLQQATFDAALQADLASIPNGPAKSCAVQLGRTVADQILAARQNDGANTVVPYTPGTQPVQWRPTPPDYSPALGPNWPYVDTFVIETGSQFRPPAPPALNSAAYTAAFYQVKLIGEDDSRVRTPEQTQIGIFWSYDLQRYGTPIVLYNQIAQRIARQQDNTLVENARFFALINLAEGDAGISAWDAKYTYDFWRPVTGIRQAGSDGNPLTIADPDWLPYGAPNSTPPHVTPPFPSYVSGHSTFGAAAFEVMANFYGTDRISFCATSDLLPGVVRHYNSFSQAANENGISRIYLGLHWSFDNEYGKKMGRAIGDYVFQHALQPRCSHSWDTDRSCDSIRFTDDVNVHSLTPMSKADPRFAFSTIPIDGGKSDDLLGSMRPDILDRPVG